MLGTLGDLLPYAVPVALSPLPIIAAVVLLLSPNGLPAAAGLVVGRIVTLAALTLAVALLAGQMPGTRGEGGGWLRVALGCLLVVGAALVWRKAARAAEAPQPGWMRSIEGATPGRAVGLGALLTAANLKELAFVLGAGLIVAGASLPFGTAFMLSLLFGALAGIGALVPVLWTLTSPDGSQVRLRAARDWLVRNNARVMAAVLLIIGAMLIGSGLEVL